MLYALPNQNHLGIPLQTYRRSCTTPDTAEHKMLHVPSSVAGRSRWVGHTGGRDLLSPFSPVWWGASESSGANQMAYLWLRGLGTKSMANPFCLFPGDRTWSFTNRSQCTDRRGNYQPLNCILEPITNCEPSRAGRTRRKYPAIPCPPSISHSPGIG